MDTVIEHNKIRFRPTAEDDIDFVTRLETDEYNSQFIKHWSREKHIATINSTDCAHFIIETIKDNKRVGFVILIGVENPSNSLYFQRIAVEPKGQGYGRDAVRIIKKFAFEYTDAHRLWLEVYANNDRAFKLYESEGFVHEGTHRESLKKGDKYIDINVMSILRREYTGQ